MILPNWWGQNANFALLFEIVHPAIDHEGYDIAAWFNERGVTAFVLKNRLPQDELFENAEIRPLQDAQQAFRIVRKNATKYGISPEKIGIMGFYI